MGRFLLILACLLVGSRSAKLSAQDASTNNKGDAIQAAKQEFQTINDSIKPPNGVELRQALPRIEPLNAPTSDVSLSRPRLPGDLREGRDTKRNPNWLVEAMMQESPKERDSANPATNEDSSDSEENLEPLERLLVEQLRRDNPKAHANTKREELEQRDIKAAVINPLEQFMTKWVSTSDQALLLSVARMEQGSVGSTEIGSPLREASQREHLELSPLLGTQITGAQNPYLSMQEPPAMPETISSAPPSVNLAPSSSQSTSQPAPTQFTLPEIQIKDTQIKGAPPPLLKKPEEDARYFPQLKRF